MNRFLIYVPYDKTRPAIVYPDCDTDRREELEEFVEQGRGRLIEVGADSEDFGKLRQMPVTTYDGTDYVDVARQF